MVTELRGLSVFVASPGGLEAERKGFFDVISKFNADDAHESGLTFIPQGHELAYAGAGRPQELINEQVRKSDYCIIVFWDKWGMQTDHDALYTSGTEEEFSIAVQSLEDQQKPMRDVIVLFKGVSDRQMSDPGEQLQKVLDFKKKLEGERRILYRTFDTLDEFCDQLRRQLSKWSRDWVTGAAGKALLPPAQSAPPPISTDTNASLVERAKAASASGQTTLAHQLFSQATTGTYDREAWTEYVRFLRRTGRFALLQAVGDKMIEKARDLNDHQGAAEGLSNLGIAKRAQGHRRAAIQYFDRALREIDAWDEQGAPLESQSMRAFVLDNKGLTWRRMSGHLNDAISAITQAISLHEAVGDTRGQGHALRNIGVVHAQLGQLDESESALTDAVAKFKGVGDERGLAMTYSALGETYELQNQVGKAIDIFELALELNTSLGNRQGKSMNMSQLSRALLIKGDLAGAEDYALGCLGLGQESGNPEGLAAGLAATGRVQLRSGKISAALESLEDALNTYQELDQPAGIAATSLDLAQVEHRRGKTDAAQTYLTIAREMLRDSPHYGLARYLRQVADILRGPGAGNSEVDS